MGKITVVSVALALTMAAGAARAQSVAPASFGAPEDDPEGAVTGFKARMHALVKFIQNPDRPGPTFRVRVGGVSGSLNSTQVRFQVYEDGIEGSVASDADNVILAVAGDRITGTARGASVDLRISDGRIVGVVGDVGVNLSFSESRVDGFDPEHPLKLSIDDRGALGRADDKSVRFQVSRRAQKTVSPATIAALAAISAAIAY